MRYYFIELAYKIFSGRFPLNLRSDSTPKVIFVFIIFTYFYIFLVFSRN